MKILFLFTIVSIFTCIATKHCTVAWVDASPNFQYQRQCYNATKIELHETQKIEYKVEVSPCADKTQNCPFNWFDNEVIANKPAFCRDFKLKSDRYGGEKCSHDLQCYSEVCSGGFCTEKLYNEACNEHADCGINLACFKRKSMNKEERLTCAYQITDNHTVCEEDAHCSNDRGCNLVLGGHTGQCVEYYSLSNFEETTSAELCQSGNLIWKDGRSVCADIALIPEEGKTTAAFECLGDNIRCKYQIVGAVESADNFIYQDCVCSRSADPKSYCPADSIGARGLAKKEAAKKRLVKGVHTLRRLDYSSLSRDYYFPLFENASEAVFEVHRVNYGDPNSEANKPTFSDLFLTK